MPKDHEKEEKQRLLKIVRDVISRDSDLREKYKIGDKFRFIRDRLSNLLERLEKHLELSKEEEKKVELLPAEDETIVYVYLYNARGQLVKNWQNMMSVKVFYEYSVNRPIYFERKHIEEFIRGKTNKNEHAFLAFIVKKIEIIKPVSETSPKDAYGNPLIKVREGSLRIEKLMSFFHKDLEYVLDENGVIVEKNH